MAGGALNNVWLLPTAGVLLAALAVGLAWWWAFAPIGDDRCVILRREADAATGATIEIVDATCQEGLPHTTDGRTIRMTEEVWVSERRGSVLKHERVHLDQKTHPREWEAFYEREWEYTVSERPPPGLPATLSTALRPNPDTAGRPWALWRGRWLFFPEAAGRLKDAPVRVWDTDHAIETTPPPEWTAFFCGSRGCPHQYEHPHELSAEMITRGDDSDAATRLFTWRNSKV